MCCKLKECRQLVIESQYGTFSATVRRGWHFLQRRAPQRHPNGLRLFSWTRRHFLGVALLGAARRDPGGQQRYRIDATIVLFGLPVFTRPGVGSGWAKVEERAGERKLQFAAGSWPEQARGLNRLGFVEERVSGSGSKYFGFMTASAEESFAEAQRALEASAGEDAKYTAIAGEVQAGRAHSRTVKFLFPAKYDWARWEELYPLASEAFARASDRGETMAAAPQAASHSFLHVLTGQMAGGVGAHENAFVYGNREMVLRSKVERERGRLRLDGKTLLGKKTLSQFRLWYQEGSPLPERVDVQVKAFLRLTLAGEGYAGG